MKIYPFICYALFVIVMQKILIRIFIAVSKTWDSVLAELSEINLCFHVRNIYLLYITLEGYINGIEKL